MKSSLETFILKKEIFNFFYYSKQPCDLTMSGFVCFRVKQAILKKEEVVQQLRQQYEAATKRANHLEGLLEQQRKQLLKK